MKISIEERQRISKLYNINESQYESFDDDFSNEPDATDISDSMSDKFVDDTFIDCIEYIHDRLGYKIEKKEYMRLLDQYYNNLPEEPVSDLPY